MYIFKWFFAKTRYCIVKRNPLILKLYKTMKTNFLYFKIYLQDKERFGKYTVSHKNKKEANGNWHVQIKCNSFDYAIYTCLVHGFNKSYNLWSNTEDYYRFRKDALRAWNYG